MFSICLLILCALVSKEYFIFKPLLLSIGLPLSFIFYLYTISIVSLLCMPMHAPMANLHIVTTQKLHLILHAHTLHLHLIDIYPVLKASR